MSKKCEPTWSLEPVHCNKVSRGLGVGGGWKALWWVVGGGL